MADQSYDAMGEKRAGVAHWAMLTGAVLFGAVFLAIVVLSSVVMLAMRPSEPEGLSLDVVVSIPAGASGGRIASILADEGIVADAQLFRLLLRLTGTEGRLRAGEYLLNPAMAPMEVIDHLNAGRSVAHSVLIPEGYTIEDIARVLAARELADEGRFKTLAYDAGLVFGEEELPFELPIASLEGYLFPDSYQFVRGQSEEELIRQMVGRFIQVVPPAIAQHEAEYGPSTLSLHAITTLASIVEREVMTDFERPMVAGVYLNRLAINMPLQADPTVRYVMTEDRSRVLYRDLEIESPYNTYRNHGLPPGPIASPGLASVKAVLEPADVDYLFFVSRRDGTHQFSRTFNEHVRARRELGY